MRQLDGKCPECHSEKVVVKDDFITCGQCGLRGDLNVMKFCDRVPVFSYVKKDDVYGAKGDLFEDEHEGVWRLEGHVQGCGRPVRGDFCGVCRSFLPGRFDRPVNRGKRSVREYEGGRPDV